MVLWIREVSNPIHYNTMWYSFFRIIESCCYRNPLLWQDFLLYITSTHLDIQIYYLSFTTTTILRGLIIILVSLLERISYHMYPHIPKLVLPTPRRLPLYAKAHGKNHCYNLFYCTLTIIFLIENGSFSSHQEMGTEQKSKVLKMKRDYK